MADFMRVKYENPKMKQSEIANHLGMSSSILQRHRNDTKICFDHKELIQMTQRNDQKRLKILVLTKIHTTKLMLKDLK